MLRSDLPETHFHVLLNPQPVSLLTHPRLSTQLSIKVIAFKSETASHEGTSP